MKHDDISKIRYDTSWVKIEYSSRTVSGKIIIKTELYRLRYKKIMKLLKDVDSIIVENYKLTLKEVLDHDEEFQRLDKHISALNRSRKWAKEHSDDHYAKELSERLQEAQQELLDRYNEVKKLYEKGGI